jgi:hypothetical protein
MLNTKQFASRIQDIHAIYHKQIRMWHEWRYYPNESTASDWSWLAHEATWQHMRRRVQISVAVVRAATLDVLQRSENWIRQLYFAHKLTT